MIKCEECLALPICIGKLEFEKQGGFTYGYSVNIYSISNCDYIFKSVTAPNYLFHDIKKFFLIKKGLIKTDHPFTRSI